MKALFTLLLWLAMISAMRAQSLLKAQGSSAGSRYRSAQQLQTLEPKVYVTGRDTIFCYQSYQAMAIAKLITAGEYDKKEIAKQSQLVDTLQSQIENLRSLVKLYREEKDLLTEKIAAREGTVRQQDEVITAQNNALVEQNKQVKWEKTKNKLFGWLGVAAMILVLILLL